MGDRFSSPVCGRYDKNKSRAKTEEKANSTCHQPQKTCKRRLSIDKRQIPPSKNVKRPMPEAFQNEPNMWGKRPFVCPVHKTYTERQGRQKITPPRYMTK